MTLCPQTSDTSINRVEKPMRKLSLDLDALTVDSFATGTEAEPRGTVQANEGVDTGLYSCATSCRCPSHHNTECC